MKKTTTLASTFLATALLVGCGSDDINEETIKIQEENEVLKQQNEALNVKLAELEKQLESLATQTTEEPVSTSQITGTTYTIKSIAFSSIEDAYELKETIVPISTNKNIYEQVLEITVPEVPVNFVTINEDQTITIDFNKEYVYGPHMTAMGQYAPFMDKVQYAMYTNFPDLKGYYFYSDGQPTSIAESPVFTEMFPNLPLDAEHAYFTLPTK